MLIWAQSCTSFPLLHANSSCVSLWDASLFLLTERFQFIPSTRALNQCMYSWAEVQHSGTAADKRRAVTEVGTS